MDSNKLYEMTRAVMNEIDKFGRTGVFAGCDEQTFYEAVREVLHVWEERRIRERVAASELYPNGRLRITWDDVHKAVSNNYRKVLVEVDAREDMVYETIRIWEENGVRKQFLEPVSKDYLKVFIEELPGDFGNLADRLYNEFEIGIKWLVTGQNRWDEAVRAVMKQLERGGRKTLNEEVREIIRVWEVRRDRDRLFRTVSNNDLKFVIGGESSESADKMIRELRKVFEFEWKTDSGETGPVGLHEMALAVMREIDEIGRPTALVGIDEETFYKAVREVLHFWENERTRERFFKP